MVVSIAIGYLTLIGRWEGGGLGEGWERLILTYIQLDPSRPQSHVQMQLAIILKYFWVSLARCKSHVAHVFAI